MYHLPEKWGRSASLQFLLLGSSIGWKHDVQNRKQDHVHHCLSIRSSNMSLDITFSSFICTWNWEIKIWNFFPLLPMKVFYTETAAPWSFRRFFDGRYKAIHMVSTITIVAEQKLVVVFTCATKCASFAFNALPGILPYRNNHVVSKLQTCWMT